MNNNAPSHSTLFPRGLFRAAGMMLIITCLIGILLSLAGIAASWQARSYLLTQLDQSLGSIDSALETTKLGLTNAENAFANTLASLETLQNTLMTTASTLETTAPALNSLVIIAREDLPNIVSAAQNSLGSAQASARVIDQVMRALAVLPIVDYDPEQPLHQSLGDLSTSLDRLPAAFFTMQAGMAATERNLQTVQGDINKVAGDVEEIRLSLAENQSVLTEYHKMVDDLQKRLGELAEKMPGWLSATAWLVTLILGWAILLQSGLFILGLALLRSAQHFSQNCL
jgi:ABC-type transporter Mla subunit MlaD